MQFVNDTSLCCAILTSAIVEEESIATREKIVNRRQQIDKKLELVQVQAELYGKHIPMDGISHIRSSDELFDITIQKLYEHTNRNDSIIALNISLAVSTTFPNNVEMHCAV